jgi:beta-galactosidase
MPVRLTAARLLLPLLLLVTPVTALPQADQNSVWIEGEAPAAINVKPNISGWGHPEYLSEGKWLQVSIEADKVERDLPAEGALIRYDFTVPKAADYEVWNRIGFEFVRSPFDWRIDKGAWSTVKPDQLTTDLMELQDWNEVAWLKMGTRSLAAGPHSLTIRLAKTKDEKGAPAHILYASDALCIHAGPLPFHPDGKHKPGDLSWQTERDRAAATHAFQMPAPTSVAQTALSLKGDWQIARYDEPGLISDRTAPIKALPPDTDLIWSAIAIPGDRDTTRPDLAFCHRYFLRTRVEVPSDLAGHSFYLHFPSVNLIASVFVNGQLCGVTDTPFAVWDCDVTKALKPGQVNEITVGIKDTYYAFAPKDQNIRSLFNLPQSFFHYNATMLFDYPVLSRQQNGILNEPTLVTAGRAYTSDVFTIPSVKNRTLGLEVTVTNPTAEPITVQVRNEVVPLQGGAPVKMFEPKTLQIAAGGDAVLKVSEPWADPKLWWPDDPQQYHVITRLNVDSKEIDARTTKFGFREWEWHGAQFTLNGVPWHGRADLSDYSASDPEDAIATWRKHGQTMERFWGEDGWGGMDTEHALDFFDARGVPIRRTGIFDGEGANGFYGLTEQVQQGGKDVTVARRALFDNWRRQLRAWARGQRNHPSIFIWSMENEITFINAHVMGLNPYTDPEMRRAGEMLAELDPTRPQMTDGGNALLDQSLPVYGGHYMEPPLTSLPEGAYGTAGFAHRQEWPVTETKPILFGESYFATGIDPADLASVGGEAAFVGKAESYPTMGLIGKMLSEGYRWSGVNFHFWLGDESDLYYNAWQPIAVLCRQWDWTFGSGQRVARTLKLFNDTRTEQAITLTATLTLGGKPVTSLSSLHHVPAGQDETFDITLPMPQVTTRQEGNWVLALSVGSKQVFRDVKAVSVLPAPTIKISGEIKSLTEGPTANRPAGRHATMWTFYTPYSSTTMPVYENGRAQAQRSLILRAARQLCIYDPTGGVIAFLKRLEMPFSSLTNLNELPSSAKVLIVGKDALDPATSSSSWLAAWAAAGRVVIVLEQKSPLRYQALPGDMAADTKTGLIAFPEDLDHPILHGLKPKDFVTWGRDGVLYRNAYAKPTSGGKSLIECDSGLQSTALAEMTAGKGLLLLCQLTIEENLTSSAPARQLLANLIDYGASYRQTFRPVAVAAADNPPLTKALDATGLQYIRAAGPLQAVSKPGGIAIVNASSANLKSLADSQTQVHAFTQNGGWIVLNNLTPEGLTDFNKLVGVDHIIRPFTREKVTFPPTRNPLTAGLATSNIVLYSGQQIFNYAAGQYVASDAFSYVVDLEDVAPFGKSPFFAYANIVNNFVSADGWPLIIDFPPPTDGKPYDIPITLPRRETIREFKWIGNTMYWPQTKVNLIFDDRDKLSFDTKPTNEPQTFAIDPPRAATKITLQIAGWQELPNVAANIGIDNIYLLAQRPSDFFRKVKPMLNIGAMVEYPQGRGGIVLCNVLYKETEAVPENIDKKRAILTAILRNLQAPYAGRSVIAGASDLSYQPLDLSKQANQFRTDRGWFGDKSFTFADLPTGRHTFANVPYNVYEFATSPVPTVVMLGGNGVPGNLPDAVTGIPVNRKADALFFLQTARIDARRNADEIRQGKRYEMADYVIHYADGQSVKVPITSEIDVDDYRQKAPAALSGAQIAWTRPYTGTDYSAVAYSMQWNNPRPNVEIRSIDLVYGPDRRGVPALLAITAATPNPSSK